MSTDPIPRKADNTVLYVVLGVGGGVLLLCIAPAIIIVICLAAVQMLGTNASMTFQTVATSIGTTTGPGNPQFSQLEAKLAADEFVTFLHESRYDRAMDRTTPEYRQRTSQQLLRQMWDGDAVLRKRDNLSYTLNAAGTGTATQQTFIVAWTDGNRQTTMTVALTRSAAGDWEVSRCSIP